MPAYSVGGGRGKKDVNSKWTEKTITQVVSDFGTCMSVDQRKTLALLTFLGCMVLKYPGIKVRYYFLVCCQALTNWFLIANESMTNWQLRIVN